MKKKSFLDSIDVSAPCDKSWDEMVGDDVSRFCSRCEKDIYNISAMTRQEAKKLLFQSSEKVCIRMERETDGRIKTLKKQLHQITRQVPLVAGVLTASLILSGATNAQETTQNIEKGQVTITQKEKSQNAKPNISGTVTDFNGVVVAGAKITLRNLENNFSRVVISNDSGFFEFRDVEIGNYEIIIAEQNGFNSFIYNNFIVESDKNLSLKLTLSSYPPTTICVCSSENIITTTEQPKLDEKITPRQIVNLPIRSRENLPILGLFPGTKESKQKAKTQIKTSQISFTIFDFGEAVIPNAEVKLIKEKTFEEFTVITNEKGVAIFDKVLRGKYELRVFANGFQTYKKNIQIKKAIEPNVKIKLTVGTIGEVIFIKKN